MPNPSVHGVTPAVLLDLWPATAPAPSLPAVSAAPENAPFNRWLTSDWPSSALQDASPAASGADSKAPASASPRSAEPGPSAASPASSAERPARPDRPATEQPAPSPQSADLATDTPAQDEAPGEPSEDQDTQTGADPAVLALAALAVALPAQATADDAATRNAEVASSGSATELAQPLDGSMEASGRPIEVGLPAAPAAPATVETPNLAGSDGPARTSHPASGTALPSGDGEAQPSAAKAPAGAAPSVASVEERGTPIADVTAPQGPADDDSGNSAGATVEPGSTLETDGLPSQPPSSQDSSSSAALSAVAQAPGVPPPSAALSAVSSSPTETRSLESASGPAAPGTGHAASHRPPSFLDGEAATQVAGAERAQGAWAESPLATRVARAIALAQQRDGEVRLRLSPPELGTLRIEMRVQEGVLLVQLHAETESARSAILDQLPVLRERLADQGIHLERFDVDLLPRHGGHGHDHAGGQPRDWPLPPRTLGPLAAASSQPRPGTQPANPRPPASSAGGLDVLV